MNGAARFVALGVFVAQVAPVKGHCQAQRVAPVVLSEPQAVSKLAFASVTAIRPLSTGEVLVLDQFGPTLYLLDARLGLERQIGRQGRGPGEYTTPSQLFALGGDTTALLETSTQELRVYSPSGEFVRSADARGCVGRRSLRVRPVRAADNLGRFYSEGQVEGEGRSPGGLVVPVVRWTESCQVDTIARIRVPPGSGMTSVGGIRAPVPSMSEVFPSRPEWAVSQDGEFAVIFPSPYHLERLLPSRRYAQGPELQYSRERVTEAHKREWRRAQAEERPAVLVGREGGATRQRIPAPPVVEPARWPAFLPPFIPGGVIGGEGGLFFVRRTGAVGAPLQYDVLSAAGALVQRLSLPGCERIVWAGPTSIFAVRVNDDGEELLVRFGIRPPLGQ